MNQTTVAVLFGGRSSEHEISLRSCVYILQNIPKKYRIIPVGISRDGLFFSLEGTFTSDEFSNISTDDLADIANGNICKIFKNKKNTKSVILPFRKQTIEKNFTPDMRILNLDADCFFPVLHGQNGEDGRLQGLFELAELAYVGCDVRTSCVGIDKDIQKRLARDAGVAIAKYCAITREEFESDPNAQLQKTEHTLGYPCFVKPNSSGSAIGTGKATDKETLQKALHEAFAFDQKVLIEEFVQGTEVECAFLGTALDHRVTVAGEIATQNFYSYEEKYAAASQAELFLPARLSPQRMDELHTIAEKVATTLGIFGLSRIDFWNCTKTNTFLFNEFNTLPGLTSISMFPKLLEHEGIAGHTWIEQLLNLAFARKALVDKTQYGIKAAFH